MSGGAGGRIVMGRGAISIELCLARRHTRFRVRAVLLVAFVTGVILVTAIGQTRSRSRSGGKPRPEGCSCVGYIWHGRVDSVSATWTVPKVEAGALGWASTWIGVETDNGRARFLQLGVDQGLSVAPGEARLHMPLAEEPQIYEAFWSDTAHNFHPVVVGGVEPGDVIHMSLSLHHARWWLRISDPRSALHLRFSTRQESGRMDEADWLEEDDLDARSHRLFAYPHLSVVTVRDLAANGEPPAHAAELRSNNLRLNVGPITGDKFTIRPGH